MYNSLFKTGIKNNNMFSYLKYFGFIMVFALCFANYSGAQNDTITTPPAMSFDKELNTTRPKKNLKNTLLINATNPLLISSQFFTVTYERVFPNNQSFTVSLGSFSIPRFISVNTDSLGIKSNKSDKGFHFSGDYRFYLKKLNSFDAPRGVYIGPYYAYNHLQRGTTWFLDGETFNGDIDADLRLNIHTYGFQLGYQFVFWNRLAVDLILFGPGFGNYSIKAGLQTTLTPEQENEFFRRLNEFLQENIPGFEQVIKPGEFNRKGSFDTWTVGYRYAIKVGFRF